MEPIRTLVADDEPEARHGAAELLRADAEIAVVGECHDGREVVSAVARTAPELVLLDVEMPDLDGFGVVRALEAAALEAATPAVAVPCLIFVTAHDRYALRAFEAHAVDYLLKPFTDERFAAALAAAKAQVQQRRAGAIGRQLAALYGPPSGAAPSDTPPLGMQSVGPPPRPDAAPPGGYLRHLAVRSAGTVSLVRVSDVDWIAADDYYARLHVAGRTHLVREPMQRLAARLDPRQFVRIHRSAIVNLDRVRRIRAHPQGGHEVVLQDGTQLLLSRSRRAALEAALGQPL